MASILPNYEYDIFISYRQNDNKRDKWVTEFVDTLKDELVATLKNPVSIYFDENPHDGLLETHDVDKSLEKKLKCLIFIPIISQTYCDIKCFAWEHELVPFVEMATKDELGMNMTLANGNVASRVLPIRIHDLEAEDISLFEKTIESHLRPIDFVYKTKGVNRPLKQVVDHATTNEYHTVYRDQINKLANGIKQLTQAITNASNEQVDQQEESGNISEPKVPSTNLLQEINRRNVPRAVFTYFVTAWLIIQIGQIATNQFDLPSWMLSVLLILLIVGLPISILLAWKIEKSPTGFIRTSSEQAMENPFSGSQKKPFTSYPILIVLAVLATVLSIYSGKIVSANAVKSGEVSIAIIPFRNNTGDETQKHFGLGMANSVRNMLSQSKQFDFISALEATTKYWNESISPKLIGEELKVNYLLTGMYQTAGDNWQVSVELVDAATGRGVWNKVFNEDFEDIFEVQEKIAQKVLNDFNLNDENFISPFETTNLEAYGHYIKGLQYHTQSFDTVIQWKAFEHFQKAVRIDTMYMDACLGMILSKSLITTFSGAMDNSYRITLTQQVSELVKQFDIRFPNIWQTNLAHGFYHYNCLREMNPSLVYFEKAVEYDPHNYNANRFLGIVYKRKFQLKKALSYLKKAIAIKPDDGSLWWNIGDVLCINNNYQLAEMAFQNADNLGFEDAMDWYDFIIGRPTLTDSLNNPHRFWIETYFYNRNYQQGINVFDTAKNYHEGEFEYKAKAYYLLDNQDSVIKYAALHDSLGVNNNAFKKLYFNDKSVIDLLKKNIEFNEINGDFIIVCRWSMSLIEIYGLFGMYEEATQTLEQLNEIHPEFGGYSYVRTNPGFDKIKAEYPPFVEALENLKLPPLIEVEKIIKL